MDLLIAFKHPLPVVYLVAINLLVFFLYAMDKISARAGAWRVRERTLLLLALLGGSAGALVGMKVFRHKTRKASFGILIAVILLIQLAAVISLWPFSPLGPAP